MDSMESGLRGEIQLPEFESWLFSSQAGTGNHLTSWTSDFLSVKGGQSSHLSHMMVVRTE